LSNNLARMPSQTRNNKVLTIPIARTVPAKGSRLDHSPVPANQSTECPNTAMIPINADIAKARISVPITAVHRHGLSFAAGWTPFLVCVRFFFGLAELLVRRFLGGDEAGGVKSSSPWKGGFGDPEDAVCDWKGRFGAPEATVCDWKVPRLKRDVCDWTALTGLLGAITEESGDEAGCIEGFSLEINFRPDTNHLSMGVPNSVLGMSLFQQWSVRLCGFSLYGGSRSTTRQPMISPAFSGTRVSSPNARASGSLHSHFSRTIFVRLRGRR
jgi:hypothetical protein